MINLIIFVDNNQFIISLFECYFISNNNSNELLLVSYKR